MKKTALVAIALLAAAVTLTAGAVALVAFSATPVFAWGPGAVLVASGKVEKQARPVGAFTAVSFAIPGHLALKQGPASELGIEADDNLLAEIESVVEDGTLKLRLRRNLSIQGRPVIRLAITAPAIASVSIAGSGDVDAEALKARDFSIAVAGSGDARFADLQAESVKVSIAGSGDVRAAGSAGTLTARIAGSGDIDASRLKAREASISIAGSGDARLWATESLSARVAGSGDVLYYGDAKLSRSIVGSGDVTRLGTAP